MPWDRPVEMLALGAMFAAAACSSSNASSAPLGKGDDVHVDVDATAAPPTPNQALPPDSPFAPVDGSRAYGPEYDAYAVLTVCSASPASDAGTPMDGASYAGDGGACDPLPAACANEPDCVCLIRELAAAIPCSYPHCSVDKGYKIYCP